MLKNPLFVYGERDLLKLPAHLNYGTRLIDKYAGHGDRAAIINAETGEQVTFRELVQQAADIALSLVRLGVQKGEVVSVCSEKRLEFIPTVLGIICAGAAFTAIDTTGGRATILHRIKLSKPSIVFCSPSAYETHKDTIKSVSSIRQVIVYEGEGQEEGRSDVIRFSQFLTQKAVVEDFLPVAVNGWSDVAIILYSSGTTGLPKGIPLTHINSLSFLEDMGEESSYTKALMTREWCYSYGLMHTIRSLYEGSTILYCPSSEERCFLEAIQNYKIQVVLLAPVTVAEMIRTSIITEYDVSSITRMISCSTSFSAELVQAVKARCPNLQDVCQIYGMSEAGCVCSEKEATKGPKPGSVGCVSKNFIIKIVDLTTRKPVGPNQRGEICLKSPSLMPGYLGDAAPDYLDEEGFFKTGDLGYYDEDRYFFIVDRIKELIKFNSYQVAPAELEAVLTEHPAVLKAGVVGAPHEDYGEVPVGFVVLRKECVATEEELVRYVDGQVSYRMRLEGGVRFIEDLPIGASGKLDRKALKRILSEGIQEEKET